MKNIGIWLDKKIAKIVSIENDVEQLEFIHSEVEDFHPVGGSGTKFKGGPQDVVQDSKFLEREKHQLRMYFQDIAKKIKSADKIIIFGPAEAKDKLHKELHENYKMIEAKIKAVFTSDKMTNNQLKSLIRDYYKDDES